ncbi:helix-turn-helix transcriptional regulator [Microbacterium sp. Marseille-Q6648]|uniref:helix-turn-helix domain-containing protein n=1 Tax=Microbacterium sp. Marseille-Q6648 TaxID=2937991 RepID=UPI00203E16B6|nr:helix-turn-helix transcriptional regulator [Microbacterium sp. Marseille-Q6648]
MTEKFAAQFGARIKRMRKAAGYRSTADLVEIIRNAALTASVLQNIESGRKAEVSVVHLLEIARALEVSPVVLLVDFAEPDAPLSIAGLGTNFDRMTAIEFDAWMQGRNDDLRDVQLGLPEQVYQLLNARTVDQLRWIRRLRLERVEKAVRMKKRYDSPAEFQALVRSVHEVESQLRSALRAGREMGIEYDPELDPEPHYATTQPEPDHVAAPTALRKPRYVDADR